MIQIQLPSVQSLFLQMKFQGQNLASGTGFLVQSPSGPLLITNRHNFTGRSPQTNQPLSKTGGIPDQVEITHNRANVLGQWIKHIEPISDPLPLWYEHPTLGSKVDVVALPLTQLHGVEVIPYDLSKQADIALAPTEIASVIGFPFGLRSGGSLAIWATGFIATEPEIDHDGLPLFLIDCRARQGQSGSAVIAYRKGSFNNSHGTLVVGGGPQTRLLGICSGRVNAESDLGFV